MKNLSKAGACVLLIVFAALYSCSLPQKSILIGNEEGSEHNTVEYHTDYYFYETFESLVNAATSIIDGVVISQKCEWRNLIGEPNEEFAQVITEDSVTVDTRMALVTVYDVRVLNDRKGTCAKGDVIKLVKLGGETKDARQKFDDSPTIEDGERYIFILTDLKNENGEYGVLNPYQSIYGASSRGEPVMLSPNCFDITIEGIEAAVSAADGRR